MDVVTRAVVKVNIDWPALAIVSGSPHRGVENLKDSVLFSTIESHGA